MKFLFACIQDLIADKKTELVATYVAQLPPDLQISWYATFLEGKTGLPGCFLLNSSV